MNKLEKLRTEVEKLEEHYNYCALCGQAIDLEE
jgi:RNA polymerase-binding transcription factor DksA